MTSIRIVRLSWITVCWLLVCVGQSGVSQEADPEEAKEKSVVDRFVVVLEKNPRRGTALDKVYGYHVERGSLDGLIKNYREKTLALTGTEAGSAWLIVGLLESLRGQDAAAVAAFEQAEKLASQNYLASYYLGQSLVLVGQPDKAAEALERSIQRKPAQADLLDVYQALGRIYQRAQKTDQAMLVWNRLEKQFPDDQRVQEQIATTLIEENEFAAALPRYESLAKNSKDKYRQTQFQMEAAGLKVRLGKADEGIAELEKLLDQLLPENWLYRDVRRRIESVYLRTDDQSGLIAYYESWIKKKPNDLDAISRLSRLLASYGRGPESQEWLQRGLKAAPKSKDLRQALISQLIYEQKYADAIAQYEQLDKNEPNNPDTLREWGRLVLKDTKQEDAVRKSLAASIWRRLTTAKPKDPLVASQVGELFRQAEMTDEALELYRKAIELAPDQAQYREYLGEYFHALKRKEEALAEWRAIAAGNLKSAANVARLAEVLASFGYLAEAVETNTEACKLDPKDFLLQVKQVDLLAQADKHDDALAQLIIVKKLAANDEEREAWISRDLRELQATEKLTARITAVRGELAGQDNAAVAKTDADLGAQWFWLARAYEAERQLKDAVQAVTKASEFTPQSVPILIASARIQEAQNNLLAAVEINTRLAAIDRRYRTEYLKQVATLEQKLGRKDKAIQAGRDLIAAAPGNPELYEFFSQLCFQLGETDEGLGALRRSVRVNPTEPKGLLLLASALGEQFRTGEAVELYWRAFEKAKSLEDRLGVVPRLTELYLRTNQFDRILERLERQRREPNQQREMTICLAQAYQSAGDDGNARQELEKLLSEDTRDTQLLTQLVKLCESDGDLEAAVKFQQQLLKSAPGKEGTMRLAQLLAKTGETDDAMAIMSRITLEEKDPETILKTLDAMLTQGNYENALQVAEKLSRDQPNNWELLYREGFALGKTKEKSAAARAVFEAILALKFSDDEPSLAEKSRLKKGQGIARSSTVASAASNPMMQRSNAVRLIRVSNGLDDNRNYGGQSPSWVPKDFGQARMACFAWLMLLERNAGTEAEFIKARREAGEKAESRREIVDWSYLAGIVGNQRDQYLVFKKMSLRPEADNDIKILYLRSLPNRGVAAGEVAVAIDSNNTDAYQKPGSKLPVLSKEELDHVLACYRSLDEPTLMSGNVDTLLQIVSDELKRADRKDEAETLLRETIQGAKSQVEIAALIPAAVERNDYEAALSLLNRLAELKPDSSAGQASKSRPGLNNAQFTLTAEAQAQTLGKLMDKRAQKSKFDDVLTLWDWYVPTAVARSQQSKIAANKRASSTPQYGPQGYVLLWRNNSNQYENLDFPAANEVFDQASIQLLRQVYSIYQTAETSKELLEHFRQKLVDSKTPVEQKNFWKFGLGYLHWWLDEKDDALTVLTEATHDLPDSHEMRFELARVHEKRGEHDLALEIIDSLPVVDQQAMQKREITALRMAVNGGNINRARLSAERLFGLRLDSGVQIQLAQQMHQLGMHEQAEAVLARAGRQAGNRTDVLANLMQQYQSQGKNEVATQMAYQLLRRSGNRNAGNRPNSFREDNSTRQHAFTVLKRSGKLPEMIKKVEGQLKNSPKSQKLLETLIEYYMANGDDKKASELASSLAETKQDDPQFRFSLGKQLMEQGKHSEAAGHFKIAFKKDSRLMRNDFWQIMNSFQNANKVDELAAIFEDLDLKGFRQSPWELTNVISNLSYQEKSKTHAVKLFKRAWEAMPDQRSQLLSSLNNDIFWQMPEIYDYAKQGIIPASDAALANGNWPGFGQIQSWGNQDGKIVTLLSRFLTLATSKKKLDELVQDIEAAQKKVPQWEAAGSLLALINLRRGKIDTAKETFERLLPTFKSSKRGDYTQWEIGQELMAQEKCADLAVLYLEAASKDPNVMQMAQMNGFQYSPGKTLIGIYTRKGRKEDARRLLLSSISVKGSRQQGNEAWEAYQRIQSISSLANEVRELGYPMDSIRLYQEQLARSEDFVVATGVYSPRSQGVAQMEQFKSQLQTGMQSAIKELRPESLPQLLLDQKGKPGEQSPIDLFLLLESRELDRTRLTSIFGSLVSGLAANPELLERTRRGLADILAQHSTDPSIRILDALLEQGQSRSEKLTTAVNQLAEFVDQTPLEPQPAKGGFTAKQREVATQQVGLWLIARACLTQESLREPGQKLADRALEASRRLSDNGYSLAILREWGQIALQAGDKEAAKRRWVEMLDAVLPKPVDKANQKTVDSEKKTDATVVETIAKSPAATSQKNPVVTLAQFEQVTQVAKLAAENGLEDLSSDAMTRALQSGPPIEAMVAIDINQNISPRNVQEDESSPVAARVQERLTTIEQVWRQKEISEETIYSMLERAVVPEARPFEVFLHAHSLAERNSNGQSQVTLQAPQSVGALLAASTVKAKNVERLKRLIEPRLKQPLGELSGRVLLSQLALAEKDFPQAQEQITLLIKRLKPDSSRTSNELASHIAIPALMEPALQPLATELLELIVDHLAQVTNPGQGNQSAEPLRTFRFSLARSHFRHKNPEAGKRQLEEYLKSLAKLYQNYGGDYGHYLRRLEFLHVAEEYAKAGQRTELLDCLGRYADMPVTQNYGQAGSYSGRMMFALATLPQADRYEILKNWTLPTADRKSVRLIAGVLPGDDTPSYFDALLADFPRRPRDSQLSSTANFLIQAAMDSGRLEELEQELLPHVEQKVEQAQFLLQLTQIAQGKGADVLPGIQSAIDARKRPIEGPEAQNINRVTTEFSDLILAKVAMKDPGLREKGRELLAQYMAQFAYGSQPMMVMSRHDYFAPVLEAKSVDRLDHEPWNTGLKHWTASSTEFGASESAGIFPMWWLANEGLLCHIFGSATSHIHLNFPLVGEFEITCDAWVGAGMDGALSLGYGGINFTANDIIYAQNYGYRGNGNDASQMRFARIMHNRFNRVRLQVSPQKVKYYVNGDLIQETSLATQSSPWFSSFDIGTASTAIRNLKITGQPEIPREVRLVPADSLLGWASQFYGETQSPARPEPDEATVQAVVLQPIDKEKEFDWRVKDGEILGRRLHSSGVDVSHVLQSRLYYQHPLTRNNRIRYEFWYETGGNPVHVHPAVGRLAFLLEADGLKLHWMTAGNAQDEMHDGLAAENVLVEKTSQRGPVKLIEQDWNNVEISLENNVVSISLNGTRVGEHPLERENSRLFGFYHDKNASAVRVRNVVLQGDWPAQLSSEIAANLLAPSEELTRAERHGYARVIDEKFHAECVEDLLAESRALPIEDRFQALAQWVLPNDDHPNLRLYGTFTSTNGLPAVVKTTVPPTVPLHSTEDGRRQYSSPELVAPVLDLIVVAKELKRLDELKRQTEPVPDDDAVLKRSKVALRTLLQITSDQWADATNGLNELVALSKSQADDAPMIERWPELVAGQVGLQHAELRSAALPLLSLMVEQYRKHAVDPAWEARVVALRDRCKSLIETDHFPLVGGASPKKQWISSRIERTDTHPWGPASRWSFRDGAVAHLGGEGDGYAYFQSPLRGSFAVEAEVSTAHWTESRLMYHTNWAGPGHPKTMIGLGNLTSQTQGPKLEPILEFDDWCRLKLDVSPSKATWFINDRQVHELPLPDKTDPWLALTASGNHSGQARKVRITGSPEIPAELELSQGDDLLGWTSSLYNDPMNMRNNYGAEDRSNDAWKITSGEIVGTKFDRVRNQKRQSVLRYHRPLAEDTVLSYEFFYVKDTTHVHPALGRTAFMLEPDGVRVHVLTDADSDRFGLRPDNEMKEPDQTSSPATIPLKENEWNQLQMALVGDQVKLKLNGVDIYDSPIATWNQRQFGLFHYANQTDVRVRNVIYRGDWPKTLPEIKDQELSGTIRTEQDAN